MWRHSPQTRRFMELLPEVGELVSIRATFSFAMTNTSDVRLDPALEGGALTNIQRTDAHGGHLLEGGGGLLKG